MGLSIEFQQVGKRYARQGLTVEALADVSLAIEAGDVYGIVGHSGAGKSTLVRLVNALERPTSGRVIVGGQTLETLSGAALRRLQKKVGMVFQAYNLLASRTVFQNVALPLVLEHRDRGTIARRVGELLEYVGLADRAQSYPAELSGGQKQRVGIARAIANDTAVLLCDEATSALDPQTTGQILELIARINRERGVTVLVITHEMSVVRRICRHVAVIDGGRIVERGPVQSVFAQPAHATTRTFLRMTSSEAAPEPLVPSHAV